MTDEEFLRIMTTLPYTRVYVSVGGKVYSGVIGDLEVRQEHPGLVVIHLWGSESGTLFSYNPVADIFLTYYEAEEHGVLSKLGGCNW